MVVVLGQVKRRPVPRDRERYPAPLGVLGRRRERRGGLRVRRVPGHLREAVSVQDVSRIRHQYAFPLKSSNDCTVSDAAEAVSTTVATRCTISADAVQVAFSTEPKVTWMLGLPAPDVRTRLTHRAVSRHSGVHDVSITATSSPTPTLTPTVDDGHVALVGHLGQARGSKCRLGQRQQLGGVLAVGEDDLPERMHPLAPGGVPPSPEGAGVLVPAPLGPAVHVGKRQASRVATGGVPLVILDGEALAPAVEGRKRLVFQDGPRTSDQVMLMGETSAVPATMPVEQGDSPLGNPAVRDLIRALQLPVPDGLDPAQGCQGVRVAEQRPALGGIIATHRAQ